MASLSILKRVRMLIGDNDSSDYWKETDEILYTLTLAIPMVESDYYQGYTMSDVSEATITPSPDENSKNLFALMTAILLLAPEAVKSSREGIYVKDGDTVIDTTRGGGDKRSSLKVLEDRYERLIFNLTSAGVTGSRVDMYPSE